MGKNSKPDRNSFQFSKNCLSVIKTDSIEFQTVKITTFSSY